MDIILLWEKIPQKPKLLGLLYSEQLIDSKGNWINCRIYPNCENCSSTNHYQLYESHSRLRFLFIPAGKCDFRYFISCPKCNYSLELEPDEYRELRSLLVLKTK